MIWLVIHANCSYWHSLVHRRSGNIEILFVIETYPIYFICNLIKVWENFVSKITCYLAWYKKYDVSWIAIVSLWVIAVGKESGIILNSRSVLCYVEYKNLFYYDCYYNFSSPPLEFLFKHIIWKISLLSNINVNGNEICICIYLILGVWLRYEIRFFKTFDFSTRGNVGN